MESTLPVLGVMWRLSDSVLVGQAPYMESTQPILGVMW